MKIKKQLENLIEEAPQYGIPSPIMAKGVVPVLTTFARNLRHQEYYILQNRAGDWVMTTVGHRQDHQIEKTVIYAFRTAQEALNQKTSEDLSAIAIPVTYLLFQLFALTQIDSIVFMEIPSQPNKGVEISQIALQDSLQRQLQKHRTSFSAPSNFA